MAWPPATIADDKAPGAPSSDTEHPDHHNALAAAISGAHLGQMLLAVAAAPAIA